MRKELEKKVERAIKLIQSASKIAAANGCPQLEVAYSGGKDSDVILELTKMAGVPYRAIYHNTTIDPSGTIKHAKENKVEVIHPKFTFFEMIARNGFPNTFKRFCCRYLKEIKTLDYAVVGVRKEESVSRAKRYKEPEQCRVYNKKEKVRQYFPILDWTKEDIAEFIQERSIKCSPIYYDAEGVFHAERRLGCMCCPLIYLKERIKQFKEHPNMVKAYIRAGQKYLDAHKDGKTYAAHNGDVYAWFVHDLFYSRDANKWKQLNERSLLPPPITKSFLKTTSKLSFRIKSFTKTNGL